MSTEGVWSVQIGQHERERTPLASCKVVLRRRCRDDLRRVKAHVSVGSNVDCVKVPPEEGEGGGSDGDPCHLFVGQGELLRRVVRKVEPGMMPERSGQRWVCQASDDVLIEGHL